MSNPVEAAYREGFKTALAVAQSAMVDLLTTMKRDEIAEDDAWVQSAAKWAQEQETSE